MEGWNGQKSFTFWASFADNTDIFSEKEQKELYFAIVRYMFFDDDREDNLPKAVRATFRQIKATCKASRANSKNGSVAKAKRIESEREAKRERNANETETKTNSNSNSNTNSNAKRERATAACPQCGGPLSRSALSINGPDGRKRIYRCECGEEVELHE